MTVAFADTPGSVIAKTEPLDFTASSEVIAISVGFGAAHAEERVYRDGVFLYPYLSSTKVGNAFKIVRTNGWPANPQLYVDEETPAPATFWSVLYDKDLRTLPNQTVSASMVNTFISFTADGQPWYFHGSSGSLMIVNGQGLVANVSGDYSSGGVYAGLHVGLKIYQMAGYDVAKETALQVRLSGNTTGAAIAGASTWCSPYEQWGYGPGDEVAVQRWDNYTTRSRFSALGIDHNVTIPYSGVAEDYATLVFAVSQLPVARTNPNASNGKTNYRAGFFKRGTSATVWPSMESMTPNGGSCERGDIVVGSQYLKMGWYAGSGGGTKAVTATHIRVLQRAA